MLGEADGTIVGGLEYATTSVRARYGGALLGLLVDTAGGDGVGQYPNGRPFAAFGRS